MKKIYHSHRRRALPYHANGMTLFAYDASGAPPEISFLYQIVGAAMDVWLWYAFYPHTEAALLARLRGGGWGRG